MKKNRVIELLANENGRLALALKLEREMSRSRGLALHEARVKIAILKRQIKVRDEVGPL